jgi:hypothetical protein
MQSACAVVSSLACLPLPRFSSSLNTIFWKKVTEYKICVLIYLRYLKRTCTYVFMESILYSCKILMKLEFTRQILKKILKFQISQKFFQREPSWSVRAGGRADRQADRHEINNRLLQFFESACKRHFVAGYFGFWTLSIVWCSKKNTSFEN